MGKIVIRIKTKFDTVKLEMKNTERAPQRVTHVTRTFYN